jgi:hypothetical protein
MHSLVIDRIPKSACEEIFKDVKMIRGLTKLRIDFVVDREVQI